MLAAAVVPARLIVVPTAWLWAVPFAAVPLDPGGHRLLVDASDPVLTPSLRFYTAMRDRPDPPAPAGAVSWVDPTSGIVTAEVAHLVEHTRLVKPAWRQIT